MYCDASTTGIGSTLMQEYNKILHPISYISKNLNSSQRNYSATKLEALALTFALETYRNIILHYPITVYTDHLPLIGILKKKTKDACINRWTMLIQEYDINLQYLPGKVNLFADALSRLPQAEQSGETDLTDTLDRTLINRVNKLQEQNGPEEKERLANFIPVKSPFSREELKVHQKEDKICQEIKDRLSSSKAEKTNKLSYFKLLDNILYVTRHITRSNHSETHLVPYIPESLMDQAFKVVHKDTTAGHHDLNRTMKLFVRNYFNNQERASIQRRIERCEPCIQAKQNPKNIPLGTYPIPIKPFQTWSIDLLGPLSTTTIGNKYIMVTRDFTTRYTILQPLMSKEADQITRALRNTISHYGSPETILSDNAAEFRSDTVQKFCRFYNIQKVFVTPFHPSSQGLVERANREINKLLRIYGHTLAVDDWDELLSVLQLTINNTYNSSIAESPFFLLYGYDSPTVTLTQPRLNYSEDEEDIRLRRIADIRQHCRKNLLKIQEKYTNRVNLNRKKKEIAVGDRTYAKLPKQIPKQKLDYPVSGPFRVVSKRGNTVTIKEEGTKRQFQVHPDTLILKKFNVTDAEDPEVQETSEKSREELIQPNISDVEDADNVSISSSIFDKHVTNNPDNCSKTNNPDNSSLLTNQSIPLPDTQPKEKLPNHSYNLRPR